MARTLHWRDLKIGIVSLTAVVAAALGVLIFGRVGTLHGKTFDVYVTTKEARGVIRGTEVWLDGQKVGLVRDISFSDPAAADVRNRIVMRLHVLKEAQPHIRVDTHIQVRSGGSMIGDQVVFMSSGTARARQIADGDTIHSRDQTDFESMSSEAAEASKELPAVIESVKLLSAQLKSVDGTLGALGVEGTGNIKRVSARTSALMNRLSSGEGTISLALTNRELMLARAQRAMAQTDSLQELVASNRTSIGRFRRDSTLIGHVTKVKLVLDSLQQLADSPNGTIGRVRGDSALIHNIHRDYAALDSLIADIKKHPLRYTPF